jgi:hypothetical protein
MAERDFVRKLERVGLAGITVVDRRPWGIDDCRRYPLFDADLIALMRRLIPPERQDAVAAVLTFTAHLA